VQRRSGQILNLGISALPGQAPGIAAGKGSMALEARPRVPARRA